MSHGLAYVLRRNRRRTILAAAALALALAAIGFLLGAFRTGDRRGPITFNLKLTLGKGFGAVASHGDPARDGAPTASTGGLGTLEAQHITIAVQDLERSAQFYERMFRLSRLPRPDFDFPGLWYDLGLGVELHLIVADAPFEFGDGSRVGGSGIHAQHLALRVESIAEAQRWFSQNGLPFIAISPRPDLAVQLYVNDPDGHTWEFVELASGTGTGAEPTAEAVFYPPEPAFVRGAAVATESSISTGAAVRILQMGGSAVDAAIAANALQSVTEPMNCGVGGDLMAMVYDPSVREPVLFDASGHSPLEFTREALRGMGHTAEVPERGPLTITTPAAVKGWCDMHARFGRLPWATLFDAAIEAAERGIVVAKHVERNWVFFDAVLDAARAGMMSNASARAFARTYSIDGAKPRHGQVFRNPALAKTLRLVQSGGCREFYAGKMAETIVAELRQQGSLISMKDMAARLALDTTKAPLRGTFRGTVDMFVPPPPAQGFTALQMVAMAERLFTSRDARLPLGRAIDADPVPRNMRAHQPLDTADYLHTLIEIKKEAYLDAARYSGGSLELAMKALRNESVSRRAESVRRAVKARRATHFRDDVKRFEGNLIEDTVGMTIADARGQSVSLLQSVYHPFGSGVVVPSLGFVTNGRCHLFSVTEPTHPNAVGPGKQPFTTLMPAFIFRDGLPWITYSGKGGDRQPQTFLQFVLNVVDRAMPLQAAINHPRFRHTGSEHPARFNMTKYNTTPMFRKGGIVNFDLGGPGPEAIADLVSRGHTITELKWFHDSHFAIINAIVTDNRGGVKAATDFLRKPGVVATLSRGADGSLPTVRHHILGTASEGTRAHR